MAEYTKFYYYRDKENKPRVTVCLLDVNGDRGVGMSVCSLLDNPCKKIGRKIARIRAVHALVSKSNNCESFTDGALEALFKTDYFDDHSMPVFKSAYNPPPTQREINIIYGKPLPC